MGGAMSTGKHLLALSAVIAALACAGHLQGPGPARKASLTIEQLIDIKHPSDPVWSPDGKRVAFVWDRADIRNLYVANADGSGQPVALTAFPEGGVADVFWSEDGESVYFVHEGDLWKVPASGGAPKPAWSKPDRGSGFVPSPDSRRVAFVRSNRAEDQGARKGSDLIVRWLSDGTESTITHDDVSIRGIVWSPDGKSIAYTGGSKIIHHDESPAYSGAKLIYRVSEYVPGQIYALKLNGGKPAAISTPGEYGGLAWVDSNRLVFDGQSKDFKKYFIYIADATTGSVKTIHEVSEEKFWSIPDWGEAGAQPWPSPNGKWIAFLSDRDGWDHLYVMKSPSSADSRSASPADVRGASLSGERNDPVQITKGKFEAWRPTWSPDGTRIAFDANEVDHYGTRHLYVATIGNDPAHATIAAVTSGRGTNIAPQWSPDGTRLVYQHTDPHNSADLWVVDVASKKATRLTDSIPAGVHS